ncbi:MAG: hypothetical protein ACFFDT_02510 [Candidatus Hodarchaeota archaeon]
MVTEYTEEYVEKFGYRKYVGRKESRLKRIWSLARFELISTWHKSTTGKVILIIVLVLNFMAITFGALALSTIIEEETNPNLRDETIQGVLHNLVGGYLTLGTQIFVSTETVSFGMEMGFLLIALIGIAGSGLFADDKQGKIVEIYLSKLERSEYVAGKIAAIVGYINIFVTLPILGLGALYVQALGENHLEYLGYYLGIIFSGILVSVLLGQAILIFSVLVDKRAFASLGFYLTYLVGSIFGSIIRAQDSSNDFLLLISPSTFLALLTFICLGAFELDTWEGEVLLNNGEGLEYLHILGLAFVLIVIMSLFLLYKIRRMTTEELG